MTMMNLNSSLFNIPLVNNVLYYDTIDSTNNKAKELAKRGSVHGSLVVAKSQTSGKGRLGRSFDSLSDDGLYFSLMLRPRVNPNHLSGITLVAALAVSKSIDKISGTKTSIKWPNDIYLGQKKLAGILTEAGSDYVALGIGINVNTSSFNDELLHTATSLYLETTTIFQKEDLLEHILYEFSALYDQFIKSDTLSFMTEDYNRRLGCLNKEVYIIPQNRSLQSNNPSLIDVSDLSPMTCNGINSEGALICYDEQNKIRYINSGEVSLRII